MAVLDRVYSAKEAAEVLGMTEGRICQICRWKGIGQKFSKVWLLTEADIERIKNLPDGRKKSEDSA